jgi:ComF family protein
MNYILQQILFFLFPERTKEKVVRLISSEDLLSLSPSEQVDDIHSLFSYKDPRVQALIWELKYRRNRKSIELLGQILAEYINEELSDKKMFDGWENPLLIGIPITKKSFRERGFCQTNLLCEEIVHQLGHKIEYKKDVLKKIRETEKQSRTKSKLERLNNLKGSFGADGNIVSGRFVILIDDVTTTGATIAEAKQALLKVGAKEVIAFTVAH